jgi:hypothetical protein
VDSTTSSLSCLISKMQTYFTFVEDTRLHHHFKCVVLESVVHTDHSRGMENPEFHRPRAPNPHRAPAAEKSQSRPRPAHRNSLNRWSSPSSRAASSRWPLRRRAAGRPLGGGGGRRPSPVLASAARQTSPPRGTGGGSPPSSPPPQVLGSSAPLRLILFSEFGFAGPRGV